VCVCGPEDILVNRQTDRQTDRRAYHNTSPLLSEAFEVKIQVQQTGVTLL